MTEIKFTVVTGKDLGDKFKAAAHDTRPVVEQVVRGAQLDLANAMKANIRSKFKQHVGAFARSIVREPLRIEGNSVTGPVGSDQEFARIQEEGGEIHAKNARNLTIPLAAFMTGKGAPKGSAHDLISSPSRYGFAGTFFHKGILFGEQRVGVKRSEHGATIGAAVALFLLKPSVTLPARPYAQPALDQVGPVFEQRLDTALEALL